LKIIFDTCVLYPTVLREILLGVAEMGLYKPVWSTRILDEWTHAFRKKNSSGQDTILAQIALLNFHWPNSLVQDYDLDVRSLWLPDKNDIHVLASAISSDAEAILTLNRKDFPKKILKDFGIVRYSPDEMLRGLWIDNSEIISKVVINAFELAKQNMESKLTLKAVLKKSYLPGLGKLMA
jgi:predicted nucleic acid-binding protein